MKAVCTLWGCLTALVATLWCLGGAGIYGSPLPAFGKEARLHCGVSCLWCWELIGFRSARLDTPAAGLVVSICGEACSCVLAGRYLLARYLLAEPAFFMLAFGLPGIMVLLSCFAAVMKSRVPAETSKQSSDSPDFGLLRITLTRLLLLIPTVALAIAHGRIAYVPDYRPSLLMQDVVGIYSPEGLAARDALQRDNRDVEGVLREEYNLKKWAWAGSGTGCSYYSQMAVTRARRPSAGPNGQDVIADLERAMQTLVAARRLEVVQQTRSPGSLLAKGGISAGFTIRYRGQCIEGLIQASTVPGREQVSNDALKNETFRNPLYSASGSSSQHFWRNGKLTPFPCPAETFSQQ